MATTLEDALAAVTAAAAPTAIESVATTQALGRTLAADVASPMDMPPFANSAMDGYALRSGDTQDATEAAPARLSVSGDARAGGPATAVGPGQTARIATGAMLPDGADAVLRVEDALLDGEDLLVRAPVAAGADVRPAGDDLGAGTVVLEAGTVLGAGELAMLAACGAASVEVCVPPRVAIVGTGDELRAPGEPLGPGQIYDSNLPMLEALVTAAGGKVSSAQARIGDSLDTTRAALGAAMAGADLVVICGGVSKGAHDHVKPALAELGATEIFWQLAMRPGHPTWFGTSAGDRPVPILGLPGNPASSYVVFRLLGEAAIAAMLGRTAAPLQTTATWRGPAQHKRAGFVQVVRCTLSGAGGGLVAGPTGNHQRSHAISSLVGVAGLALLAADVTELRDGDAVPVRIG